LEAGPKTYGPREPGYVKNRTPLMYLSNAFGPALAGTGALRGAIFMLSTI
jgi:hypothetical protein